MELCNNYMLIKLKETHSLLSPPPLPLDYNPSMTRFTSETNNNDDYHSDCTCK